MQPAIGSAIFLALGLERVGQPGVPEGALVRYDPSLPAGGELERTEEESSQVNPDGFLKPGVPGAAGGSKFPVKVPLNPRQLLRYYEHLFGKVVKAHPVSAASAVGTHTFAGVSADGETVTIGADIYEFRTAGAPSAGNIAVDVSGAVTAAASATALIAAITASGTEPVTAADDGVGVTVITATATGVDFNAIVTAETTANGSWAATHMTGGANDVFTYTFTPEWSDRMDTTFWGAYALPPVEKALVYGLAFESIKHSIGNNTEIPVEISGLMAHGSQMGPGTPKVGNTGTYAFPTGPFLRGLVANPDAGKIWVKLTDDDPLLKFKALQSIAEPSAGDWAAAAIEHTVRTTVNEETGATVGTWQNLQSSATGLDLGIWNVNKDPLEICWPGTAAEHATADTADIYSFELPNEWANPAASAIAGGHRFTSAHWITRFRAIGAATYTERGVNEGSIEFMWKLLADGGNLSRYPQRFDRDGPFTPTVEIKRKFRDRFFGDRLDRHEKLDVQMAFEGRQLTDVYREGMELTMPSTTVTKSQRPAAKPGVVEETITMVGKTDENGVSPATLVVTTDYDFELAAAA